MVECLCAWCACACARALVWWQLLGDALAAMLEDVDRVAGVLNPREVVLQAKQVYSACFFEVLRQVRGNWEEKRG